MAKSRTAQQKGSLVGMVGGILIGAAMVLYVATIVLGQLKTANTGIPNAMRNDTNTTIDTLVTFLRICVILFGVLGITMIGGYIIAYITGAFGG